VVLDIQVKIKISMVKYIYLGFVLLFLASCGSVKNTSSSDSNKGVKTQTSLNSSEKRKFDYFFYEAQRLKLHGDLNKSKLYYVECLKIDPNSSVCYYELANIEIGVKNYTGAQDLLVKASNLDSSNKYYQRLLGDIYQQNGQIGSAITTYQNLSNRYPDNIEYLYVLSQLYTSNKQFEEAISSLDLLEKQLGLNEMVSLEKEKLYLELGKNNSAYKEVNALIKDNPYEPRYYGFLGDVYLYTKDLDKAESAYMKILELDSTNGLGFFSLANIELQRKDTVKFFSYFQNGLKDTDLNIEVKFQRMLPFLMSDEFKNYSDTTQISSLFEILTEVHSNDARSFYYKANYVQKSGDKRKALSLYKQGLEIEPENAAVWQDLLYLEIELQEIDLLYSDSKEALLIYPDEAVFCFFHGISCMQLEKWEEAKLILIQGEKNADSNMKLKGQIYASLGDVYYSLKDTESAFKAYDQALLIDEHNIIVLNNYSYYLSLENKDLDKAEKMVAKSVELEPGNSTYLDTYAWVLFKRSRFFEAKYIIERAIDNGGDTSDVIVEHYGDILFKNGDILGAVEQWKKSLDMGNKSETLLKKIESESYIEN